MAVPGPRDVTHLDGRDSVGRRPAPGQARSDVTTATRRRRPPASTGRRQRRPPRGERFLDAGLWCAWQRRRRARLGQRRLEGGVTGGLRRQQPGRREGDGGSGADRAIPVARLSLLAKACNHRRVLAQAFSARHASRDRDHVEGDELCLLDGCIGKEALPAGAKHRSAVCDADAGQCD